jgi:hypothetical protein
MLTMSERETKNFNFAMPMEFADEFRAFGDRYGERNKMRWAIAAAAVLKLLELPEAERESLVREIYSNRYFPERMSQMLRGAKAKAAGRRPKVDVSLMDEAGNALEEGPEKSPAAARPRKPAR